MIKAVSNQKASNAIFQKSSVSVACRDNFVPRQRRSNPSNEVCWKHIRMVLLVDLSIIRKGLRMLFLITLEISLVQFLARYYQPCVKKRTVLYCMDHLSCRGSLPSLKHATAYAVITWPAYSSPRKWK